MHAADSQSRSRHIYSPSLSPSSPRQGVSQRPPTAVALHPDGHLGAASARLVLSFVPFSPYQLEKLFKQQLLYPDPSTSHSLLSWMRNVERLCSVLLKAVRSAGCAFWYLLAYNKHGEKRDKKWKDRVNSLSSGVIIYLRVADAARLTQRELRIKKLISYESSHSFCIIIRHFSHT